MPGAIYAAAQVRELDRRAIERGVLGYELMSRAGRAALDVLRKRWPATRSLQVYCGAGNNGGDGYVVARLAHAAGLEVRVLAVTPPERLRGDAAAAAADCAREGVRIEPFAAAAPANARRDEVVVDALLGTGADRPLEGAFAAAVAAVNASEVPVLALDVPSGLDADRGLVLGAAVRATVTVTFVGLKQGLFLGESCDYCGELEFADLGVAAELAADLEPVLQRLGARDWRAALPKRPRSAHKGSSGRLLLVGGGPGMPGAIRLAAEAALRTGAGLVYVAGHAEGQAAVLAGRPEIIFRAVEKPADLAPLIELADAAVVGPGLGRSSWARPLWHRLRDSALPLVVDADALNLLAEAPGRRADWIITPHPGEAARLLNCSIDAVQRDRIEAVRQLASRFGAAAVLKGPNTLVALPDRQAPLAVCDRGNPGMATAGMGDVLAGVLGALRVQTRDLAISARAGVLLHALAGDAAAASGERGTVAGDLMLELKRWANPS